MANVLEQSLAVNIGSCVGKKVWDVYYEMLKIEGKYSVGAVGQYIGEVLGEKLFKGCANPVFGLDENSRR